MEVTKKDVEQLIEVKKKNTFLRHFLNVFLMDMKSQGEVLPDRIKLWRQNSWNQTFYPVFTFHFNKDKHLIDITDKLNPFGKALIGLIACGVLFLFFSDPSSLDYIKNWRVVSAFGILVALMVWVARSIYRFEKKNELHDILEFLEVEVEEEIEKEWSLKNTLIRLFTYPFCLFIVSLIVFFTIPQGDYLHSLVGLGIVGFYIVADIKLILRERKTKDD